MISRFFNIIFPPKCLNCNVIIGEVGGLCSLCFEKINFTTSPSCAICAFPFEYDLGEEALCAACINHKPAYDKAFTVFTYNEHSKELIHKFKFADQTYATPYFANWIKRAAKDALEDADIIIPVPLHKLRLYKRMYNQSALLAKAIARISNVKYNPYILKRIRNTTPQSGLSQKQRQGNVKNAFAINPKQLAAIKGKNIILIDDVMTTGATIEECCKILRKAGVSKIYVVTLARTFINS
jgi:ComF family protein